MNGLEAGLLQALTERSIDVKFKTQPPIHLYLGCGIAAKTESRMRMEFNDQEIGQEWFLCSPSKSPITCMTAHCKSAGALQVVDKVQITMRCANTRSLT